MAAGMIPHYQLGVVNYNLDFMKRFRSRLTPLRRYYRISWDEL